MQPAQCHSICALWDYMHMLEGEVEMPSTYLWQIEQDAGKTKVRENQHLSIRITSMHDVSTA